MNAKEKQKELIESYLKPTLKTWGYAKGGQTWWKDKGEFFTLINLQNFSWNTRDSVNFCFNIGIVLKATMKDTTMRKPNHFDLVVCLRHDFYLPEYRRNHKYIDHVGYLLTDSTIKDEFLIEFKTDFENHVLPDLDRLNSLNDCLNRFKDTGFWFDHLNKIIADNNITI